MTGTAQNDRRRPRMTDKPRAVILGLRHIDKIGIMY